MDYKEILEEMGFSMDWGEGGVFQYSDGDVLIQILEKEDGYHEFSACPKKCFDRWANSRHINWKLMVVNYTEEKKHGWTEEAVIEDLERNVNDAIWLTNTLPERMFDKFINIDL